MTSCLSKTVSKVTNDKPTNYKMKMVTIIRKHSLSQEKRTAVNVIRNLIIIVISLGQLADSVEVVGGLPTFARDGLSCPPTLPVILNSNLTTTTEMLNGDSLPGTRLLISCADGYRGLPSKENYLECKDGEWMPLPSADGTRRLPECQVWCRRPTVAHGKIINKEVEFPLETKVEIQCDEGYRLANKFVNALQCSSKNGEWTGHNGEFTREFPQCVLATCPPLPITPNSILDYRGTTGWDGGFLEKSRVSYACRQGYRMSFEDGSTTERDFECHNGVWQNLIRVSCELVGCGPPPSILDGEIVIDLTHSVGEINEVKAMYPVGMRILYRCNHGFILIGSSKRYRCSAKGSWVPSRLPICRILKKEEQNSQDCPAPPIISHARFENVTKIYHPGSVVIYSCDDGFFIDSQSDLTCDQSGQWQPQPGPTCRPNVILPEEDCLKPATPYKTNDISRGDVLVESRQIVPLLVATVVSALLLTVLLAVQLTKQGGWKYLAGWRCSGGIPMGRSTSQENDDVTRGRVVNPDSNQRLDRSQSSLLYCEPDRVSLLNGCSTRGQPQVLPPTYEEAIQDSQIDNGRICSGIYQSDMPYSCMTQPNANRNRCYRFANLRGGGGNGFNEAGLQPSRHSAYARSSSVADSLNSTDTVTPSEVSTTVTVDTLSSNASSHPTSSTSTRAFCGSLASFDTAESDSALNMEGVPLLEETEVDQGISPTSETRAILVT